MKFDNLLKNTMEREVPNSMVDEYCQAIRGKTPQEILQIREQFAQKIAETCPYKPGKEPQASQTIEK